MLSFGSRLHTAEARFAAFAPLSMSNLRLQQAMQVQTSHHIDASDPQPDGSYDYYYEYDVLRFCDGEMVLMARSYSDNPSEAHFLRVEHGTEARRLKKGDMASTLAAEAVAYLRLLGKVNISWLSGAGNGYEPLSSS